MEERREYRSWKRPEKERREFRGDDGFRRESRERKPLRSNEKRGYESEDSRAYNRDESRPKRPRISTNRDSDQRGFRPGGRSFDNRRSETREFGEGYASRPRRSFSYNEDRGERRREFSSDRRKPFLERDNRRGNNRKSFDNRRKEENYYSERPNISNNEDGLIRLNKYISNSGICSRREADVLIAAGSVTVNGQVITQMGYKVKETDQVCYDGQQLSNERKVYLLLNKPKGFITTLSDPQERKTVMNLVGKACRERIYPVGRLDRNTSGLLLFTNDGELTKKLTHPSFGARKIYHVELNKPLTKADMQRLLDGIELEDGFTRFDDIQYVETANSKKVVGVELHSGKNRIVRRMFNHLEYDVEKLDRVSFAGLTKKDLPRGHYRFLNEKEVVLLKR